MSPLRPLRRHLDAVDDSDATARPADAASRSADALDTAASELTALVRTTGFWLGVVLPFLHLPLLFGLGLTESTTPALVGLWGLNAVAITVGAGHEPTGGETGSGTPDTGAAEADAEASGATAD
jgi:hypothetical protein